MERQNLKEYISNHPDNKMAWYLLGRSYAEQGQMEKAIFCFEQSEEVYEAYETEPLETLRKQMKRKKRLTSGSFWSKAALSIAAGVLIVFGLWSRISEAPDTAAPGPPPVAESTPAAVPDAVPTAQAYERIVYVPTPERPSAAFAEAIAMTAVPDSLHRSALLMQAAARTANEWTDWNKPFRYVMGAAPNAPDGGTALQYFDPELCVCEPIAVDSRTLELANDWKQDQEALFVLKSALYHHIRDEGGLPASLDELTRDYPNNRISGVTPEMLRFYHALQAQLAERQQAGELPAVPKPEQLQREVLAANDERTSSPVPLMPDPLEIIVDTSAHRLALLSGDMIIRSYPVGLGGERTPAGTFEITEKVRNPNGRSDGDFGSRGMTLSDTLYAIHGTNEPDSIGKDESLGCVRMANEDIEELFDLVPIGTKVTIKAGGLGEPSESPPSPFALPSQSFEENPGKRYNWL